MIGRIVDEDGLYPIQSHRHSLFTGWVVGCALRHGLTVEPIRDEAGEYTAAFAVALDGVPDNVRLVLVVPPPPTGWAPP